MKTLKLKFAALLTLALFFPAGLLAQSMMMEDNGMMSGWMMFVCAALVILLFVILVLGILALLKYLFGRKH